MSETPGRHWIVLLITNYLSTLVSSQKHCDLVLQPRHVTLKKIQCIYIHFSGTRYPWACRHIYSMQQDLAKTLAKLLQLHTELYIETNKLSKIPIQRGTNKHEFYPIPVFSVATPTGMPLWVRNHANSMSHNPLPQTNSKLSKCFWNVSAASFPSSRITIYIDLHNLSPLPVDKVSSTLQSYSSPLIYGHRLLDSRHSWRTLLATWALFSPD